MAIEITWFVIIAKVKTSFNHRTYVSDNFDVTNTSNFEVVVH